MNEGCRRVETAPWAYYSIPAYFCSARAESPGVIKQRLCSARRGTPVGNKGMPGVVPTRHEILYPHATIAFHFTPLHTPAHQPGNESSRFFETSTAFQRQTAISYHGQRGHPSGLATPFAMGRAR